MALETTVPLSPGWWLDRLARRLAARKPRLDLLESYYRGEPPVRMISGRSARQAYSRLMEISRTNFAELVVEAVRERMSPSAFRTGAVRDDTGDELAWGVWQANALDADCALVHRMALSMGLAYVIVGGVDDEIGAPLITVEDPRCVVVEPDPVRRRKPRAAAKVQWDELAERWWAWLYLPGFVAQAVAPKGWSPGWGVSVDVSLWDWFGEPQRLPADVVPVVEFSNNPDGCGRPAAEFERHVGILDRINYTVLERLEIATLQAFRQRAIKGVPNVDENGDDIDYSDIFAADPGALWLLPETANVWESGQVDLGPLRQAIRDDVQDLAAVTRTPLYYLTPDSANGSAEGASLAREGLIFKTYDRVRQMGEAWEQAMSLAFTFLGDPTRAARRDLEVVWTPPERFSLSERYDAASKAQAAGVPWSFIMASILQFSPQEIARMRAERVGDLLFAGGQPAPGQVGGAQPQGQGAQDVKDAADAMGVLIRAGVEPDAAAAQVGLSGLRFREGAVPAGIRLPAAQAAQLEDR